MMRLEKRGVAAVHVWCYMSQVPLRRSVLCMLLLAALPGCALSSSQSPASPQASVELGQAIAGAGCTPPQQGTGPPRHTDAAPTATSVAGIPSSEATRLFTSVSAIQGGEEFLVPGTQVTVGFDVTACTGGFAAGCNRKSWIWDVVNGRLEVQWTSSTILACGPATNDPRVVAFFDSHPRAELNGDTLVLETADTVITLVEDTNEGA